MAASEQGFALTFGDLNQVIPMAFPDAAGERQLQGRLKSGDDQAISVRITPLEQPDVEGHAFGDALRSVWVQVHLDDDDVEGHAISMHFPTTSDADRFRKRLLAAGLLTGAIVLGSAGAVALANQPASSGATIPAQTQADQAPVGHGFVEGADISGMAGTAADSAVRTAIGGASAIDPATNRPARSGLQAGADVGTGAAADNGSVAPASGHNWVEGADK
jgi:hypothetical protein